VKLGTAFKHDQAIAEESKPSRRPAAQSPGGPDADRDTDQRGKGERSGGDPVTRPLSQEPGAEPETGGDQEAADPGERRQAPRASEDHPNF
jgi:hypothetical protein